jgi:hypothetical protein
VDFPYGPAFAFLCLFQGLLVAPAWRRPWRAGASRLVGIALPIVVFLIGLAATRGTDWSVEAVSHLATFGTPVAAAAVGYVWGWRMPLLPVVAAPALWILEWRADGLTADIAGLALIGAACLTLAAVIAAFTPPWALAAGLVVLAVVDSILVFTDQVRPGTQALHAVVPPTAGGMPLPALQDATLDRALFGWLDILAPALCATLLAGAGARRIAAAVLVAVAALAFGLLLAVADQVPGTIPPLVAVGVWLAAGAGSHRPLPSPAP